MSTPTNNSIFNPGFSDSNLNHLSENSVSASVSSTQKMQSKVLFGGGVSDSSQQQGELISFVNPIERGVSLVLVRSLQGLCCANVGSSGAKMCFRQSRDLGICPASHARNKADLGLASPTLFRVDAGATSCTLIICPSLEVHDIDDSAIQVMLGGQYAEEAWSEEVRAHEGARTVNKSVEVFKEEVRRELSSIQTPLLRKKLAQSATPGKMDRHEVERLRLETLQYIHEEAHKEVTGPISTAVKDTTLYLQDKQFKDHFEAVEHRDDALIKVLTSTRKLISYGLEAVADDIIDVNDVLTVVKHDLQSIKERVGVKIADPGTLDGLTVWEAIKKLCDFVESTGLVALQESGISLATTSYIEAMIDGNTPLAVMLASHTNKIEGLETALRTLTAQGRDGPLFANPSPASTSVASNADFLELMEKVTQLEKRLASSQTVGSDMTVQFRGHIFNSQHDVNNFMKSCIGSSSVPASLINDAYTLLNAVAKGMTGQVMDLKDIYSVSRMGDITEADLQNAIAGNQTGVPPFFRGGPKAAGTPVYTGTGTGPKNRLKGIPDYAAWGNPGSTDGIRYKALLELDRIVQSTRNDIQARVSDPTISQFLEHMLSRSHEFIRKLFDFITDTYASLIQTFENSTSTWDFVCHCVEHIFMHEFDVARSILRGHDVKSEQFNERMLWTSLRTVVIQETFLSKTFQNHDSLSGAYSTFLLKNSQSAEVNSMKRKLEKMESVVESLNSKIAKFDSKVKGAEGAADKVAKGLKEFKEKMGNKK